ncbi:MAG: dTDP-4-dehydrorhamnose 3,5-epimerase [Cyclobacteriaceae bacterium]
MKFFETELSGAFVIELEAHRDTRGLFVRTHCRREFLNQGLFDDFVQSNLSITIGRGTLRGLHLQKPPYDEIKLIQCIRGAVLDVIVDLREGSPTFLKHLKVELSEKNFRMLYVPKGFAHGFQTLTDRTNMAYRQSAYYKPEAEIGLRYDDPKIGIEWPLEITEISQKDKSYSWLDDGFFGI